ncbi:hypothetical protein Glove_79g103 [Diversispora epigaea]|uniref:Uncharacterized protein n=1 Tax=Diversispora epigaea TaxID=1348612 RepID=A0A397JI30_9GLOM|nr:hypothetical protein Glove_79g103 [Diversispora epigaea]
MYNVFERFRISIWEYVSDLCIESGIIDIETYLHGTPASRTQYSCTTVYKVQGFNYLTCLKKEKKKNAFAVDEPMIKEYKR